MDWYTGFYSLICILSVAYIYFFITKRIPSRLEPNHAPKSSFGLVPAYNAHSPARASGVDIIFVHGLGSNPDKTWCTWPPRSPHHDPTVEAEPNGEKSVNWVSDFLPDDLPPGTCKDIRMFFYNYDSYWKRDAVHTRLKLEGNNLLEHIRQIRGSEYEKRRTLMFVGHSYGGLVIKQALIQSQASQEFNDIAEYTKAALFLGTPHRGSSVGPWGWLVAQALQPLGSNPLIVGNLEYDSISLFDLHDHFIRISSHLQVFNFFEQRPMIISRLWFLKWQFFCVREQSATYVGQNVRNIGLAVDHYGLNKFGSKDANFQSISSAIVETITSLVQPERHSYSVPIETVQTFAHREQLWDELETKLQIRHETSDIPCAVTLYGLGGAGKSQLALKYAELKRHQFNPILWLDATDEESIRSSFIRCAAELGLRDEHKNRERTALVDDPIVQGVLRWLRDRNDLDDRWLVIIDNADDIGWGIKKVIPKGKQGSLIITSRDEQSQKLIDRGCERIRVDVMSPLEARDILLQHLSIQGDLDFNNIQDGCDEVAKRLGYLPLAVDLAGAYLGNEPEPCEALSQYLDDFEKHHDALLKMNELRGLSPTEKTVWTVWDTTLDKIDKENGQFEPGLLLTFMAHFKGPIIQDQIFNLASLGMPTIEAELGNQIGAELRQFIRAEDGKWDSFFHRQSLKVLLRYSLIQRVHGDWEGVTMHSVVRWRAKHRNKDEPWELRYACFIFAACYQITAHNFATEFRRHLAVHIPEIGNFGSWPAKLSYSGQNFLCQTFALLYHEEGQWDQTELLLLQAIEASKANLGATHPNTLEIMSKVASIYQIQGRWREAEKIFLQVIETSKSDFNADHLSMDHIRLDHLGPMRSIINLTILYQDQDRPQDAEKLGLRAVAAYRTKLGINHSYTVILMKSLASIYQRQGRWKEAEQIQVHVTQTQREMHGADHPDALGCMSGLALTYIKQGRMEDATKLQIQVLETFKARFGDGDSETLKAMANLASSYMIQGRLEAAKELQIQALETSKSKFGVYHPDTLQIMSNLALTYWDKDQLGEAEQLQTHIWQTRTSQLGVSHPLTLISLNTLALIYWTQGLWEKAQRFLVQIAESRKTNLKLGVNLNMRVYVTMSNDMFGSWLWGLRDGPDQLKGQISLIKELKHGNIQLESDTPGTTAIEDTGEMSKFELCGIRSNIMTVPSLIPSSSHDKWTILYLISLPLPADISALHFEVIGYDQGFGCRPQDDTWSWFEVSILGSWREIVNPNFANLDDPKHPKSCPGDFGGYLQEQGLYFKDIPGRGIESPIEPPNISLSFARNSTQKQWKHQSILWSRGDSDGNSEGARFLSVLEEGDRLAIWVRAKFSGMNRVKEVKVHFSTNIL